jgi:hypothetical protein
VIDHKLDFSGLLDISRDMELLSKAENKRFCVTAHAQGRSAKEEVIKRAPERTGKLKRNVVVVTKRGSRNAISSGVHIRGVNPRNGKQRQHHESQQPAQRVLLAFR